MVHSFDGVWGMGEWGNGIIDGYYRSFPIPYLQHHSEHGLHFKNLNYGSRPGTEMMDR